ERLDHDVVFRSVATRLVQRYGYLLPTTNPNSPSGKEEDLVLKERARRLVQIEAQEDTESLKPNRVEPNQELNRTSICDPEESSCAGSSFKGRQSYEHKQRPIPQNEVPVPEANPRLSPEMPHTLQTELSSDTLNPRDMSADPQLELASAALKT